MSALDRALAAHRRQLARRERDAFRQITRTYTRSYRELQTALDRLHDRVEQAVATGQRVSPAWLYQQERFIELQAAIGRELERAVRVTGDVVEGEVAAAVNLAEAHAQGLVQTSLGQPPVAAPGMAHVVYGSWTRLNVGATQVMLGFVQGPGSPVGTLLRSLAPHGQQEIGDALVDGIARGLNPRETRRVLSRMMGGQTSRALTIARTETMRAYREATRSSYLNNKRLVLKWEWQSALDRRTCAACWSMHGETFNTEAKLDGHPNCRCVMVPVTPTWNELGDKLGFDATGIPETRRALTTGAELFGKLDADVQRAILGPAKHALYASGQVQLRDVVKRTRSKRWGTMRREATVKEAVSNARARG